jgi:hypothetical protein
MEKIRLSFFKDGSEAFFEMLDTADIPYEKIQLFPPGTLVASGEAVEIIKAVAGLAIFPSLAAIIVQWLKANASRKVYIQQQDNSSILLEGYSVKDIEKIFEDTKRITIIQTEADE